MNESKKDIELRQKIQNRLQIMSGYHSRTYDYIKEQLEFVSGNQWDSSVLSARQLDKRPSVVLNLTKTYVNRVVNPVRMNPIGIRINTDNPELTEFTTGVIREVEANSRAQEAYEVAYDHAVSGGLGWVKVGTDYRDDSSLEQKVVVDLVRNPLSVWLDPYSKRVDGSDAEYGVCVEYLSSEEAQKMYGDEAVGDGMGGINLFEYWNTPEDSTADMTYYEIEREEVDRYWYEDGEFDDEEPNPEKPVAATRKIVKKSVRAVRYVGNKKVDEVVIPIPYIPLIPVYGDQLYLNNGDDIHLAGIPHWLKDSQRMVNYYGSNELELAALAPKAPWIVAEGQIEGYEDTWAEANHRAVSALPYKPETIGGQMVPPPVRADNQAQTGGLMQSRQKAQEDMAREIGIFDNMMGQVTAANETGKAALLRANQGELPTAHYLQNLQQSIAQVGRVVLHLLAWVGDTPRLVGVRDAQGNKVMVTTTLSEVFTDQFLQHAEVETSSGPAYESRRRESINAILQMAQIMPDKMSIMADLLVRNMDAPGSQEIADRLHKALPPEFKEGGEGPTKEELQMQLQQAQQQIAVQSDQTQKLQGIIQQLQARILSGDKDRQADLAKVLIKEEGAMARERIKQSSEDERMAMKIEAEAESDMRDLASKVIDREEDRVDMRLSAAQTPEDYVPPVPGPISTDQAENTEVMRNIDETLRK